MVVLLLGADDDPQISRVMGQLSQQKNDFFLLDTRRYPQDLRLGYRPGPPMSGWIEDSAAQLRVGADDIQSIYWRQWMGFILPPDALADPHLGHLIQRELHSSLGSYFRNLATSVRWVNPPQAVDDHQYKTHQLHRIQLAGLPVPRTLVTNDGAALRAFFEEENGRVIYKPVLGGAHTRALTPEDFSPERLSALSRAPVQFQQWVEGTDIRVYGIGESFFAAAIESETLDFRDHPGAPIVPIELPESVIAQCRVLMTVLNYRFSGIDIRVTPEGDYIFLEGNPSPMFAYFEDQTGYPITQTLVSLLTA